MLSEQICLNAVINTTVFAIYGKLNNEHYNGKWNVHALIIT